MHVFGLKHYQVTVIENPDFWDCLVINSILLQNYFDILESYFCPCFQWILRMITSFNAPVCTAGTQQNEHHRICSPNYCLCVTQVGKLFSCLSAVIMWLSGISNLLGRLGLQFAVKTRLRYHSKHVSVLQPATVISRKKLKASMNWRQ